MMIGKTTRKCFFRSALRHREFISRGKDPLRNILLLEKFACPPVNSAADNSSEPILFKTFFIRYINPYKMDRYPHLRQMGIIRPVVRANHFIIFFDLS